MVWASLEMVRHSQKCVTSVHPKIINLHMTISLLLKKKTEMKKFFFFIFYTFYALYVSGAKEMFLDHVTLKTGVNFLQNIRLDKKN